MADSQAPATPVTMAQATAPLARRQLTLLPLVMVLFFSVSGGAYGLEDLIGASGPGMALVLIVVTPLIWSLPTALMVSELSTAMPSQGGYYDWCKRALGPFWGFQEAWWRWICSFVDMAIYPVLFADYLSTLLVEGFGLHIIEQNPLVHWLVTLFLIWFFVMVNLKGSKAVGGSSNLFGLFILLPFAVMAIVGIARLIGDPTPIWQPFVPPGKSVMSMFSTGLFVVMWNYLGWDSVSTVADEIHEPKRNYPRGLSFTIPLVTLCYLLRSSPGSRRLRTGPAGPPATSPRWPVKSAESGSACGWPSEARCPRRECSMP